MTIVRPNAESLTSVTFVEPVPVVLNCDRARLYRSDGYNATLAVRDAAPLTVSLNVRPASTGPGEELSDNIPGDTPSSFPPTPGDALPSSIDA